MAKRKTHEEFVEKLKLINPNIEAVGVYQGALEPILCRCLKDEYEWRARPSDLLKGGGCPICAGNKKKTHEEFIEELSMVNPHIKIISQYKNTNEKVLCKCMIDDYEWFATPNKLLHGRGCPKCKTQKLKTICVKSNDEFVSQLKNVNSKVEVVGEYINNRTPIKCRCKIDGYVWSPTPSNLLKGYGCPKCGNVERINHEEFINRLNCVNHYIEVLERYINMSTKIACRCKKCSHQWSGVPASLLNGVGCPHCNISKGENTISDWLKRNDIKFTIHKKFENLLGVGGGNLSYDFYLEDHNILIEYQGQFHDMTTTGNLQTQEQFEKQKEHDRRKREYAKQKNIELLEIWHWDFNNIEQILNEKLHINNTEKSA